MEFELSDIIDKRVLSERLGIGVCVINDLIRLGMPFIRVHNSVMFHAPTVARWLAKRQVTKEQKEVK